MASLSSQRIGNTIKWSLQLISRSRTLAFTFSSRESRGAASRPYSSTPASSSSSTNRRPEARHPTSNTSGQRQSRRRHAHFATPFEYPSSSSTRASSSPSYSHNTSSPHRPYATTAYSTTRTSSTPAPRATSSSNSVTNASSTTLKSAAAGQAATKPTNTTQNAAAETSPPTTVRSTANPQTGSTQSPIRELAQSGLSDDPASSPASLAGTNAAAHVDWTSSFHGLSAQSFSHEASQVLMQSLDPEDIEIKPDGIIYLPEIKYRRILNRAFGPGGWGLAPRGETIVTAKAVTREYALVVHGRLVSIARGEQDYFGPENIPTASEGCKSNALMRCCKDLGIASELWDPRYIRKFLAQYAKDVWVEHTVTKKRKKISMRKDDEVRYPFKEVKV